MNLMPSTISPTVRPNFARSPALPSHLPAPFVASFARIPTTGRTPTRWETSASSLNSENFSMTMIGFRPSFCAMSAVSMNSESLYPLQMMSASGSSISARTMRSSGLEPASRPMW